MYPMHATQHVANQHEPVIPPAPMTRTQAMFARFGHICTIRDDPYDTPTGLDQLEAEGLATYRERT